MKNALLDALNESAPGPEQGGRVRHWLGKRVVAAMTTTPRRIALIEPTLDSLLRQTRPLDAVYLFVPHKFRRDNSEYVLPPWLLQKEGVTVVRCEDHGPSTHMMEVLKVERDPRTFILQVDDDQQYGSKMLDMMLRSGTRLCPGRAIGGGTQHDYTYLASPVLEGVHGVLFQRSFFDPSVFDYEGFHPSCRLHDDLWLSAHLAKRGVQRECMHARLGTVALDHGFAADALYNGGAGTDNTYNFYHCMASLLRAVPRLWEPAVRVVLVAPLLPADLWPSRTAMDDVLSKLALITRHPEVGPHALYLLAPSGTQWEVEDDPKKFRPPPGGLVFHAGTWADTVDVVVHSCTKTPCDWGEMLEVALSYEQEPESVIVWMNDLLWPWEENIEVLQEHVQCMQQDIPGKGKNCVGRRDSFSFRRIAAFEENRVAPAAFMERHSSKGMHRAWIDSWLQVQGATFFRDTGDWKKVHPSTMASFKPTSFSNLLARLPRDAQEVNFNQRVVATTSVKASQVRFLGATLRTLLNQTRKPTRIYIFIRSRGRSCAPAWLRGRFRTRILCGSDAAAGSVVGLLRKELRPATFIVTFGLPYLFGPRLIESLMIAFYVFTCGVAAQAFMYGPQGGPLPVASKGFIFRRSFVDSRLESLLRGPCEDELGMALSAHFAVKGLVLRALGDSLGARSLPGSLRPGFRRKKACHTQLVEKHWSLWSSRKPQRAVLWVSLYAETEEHLLNLNLRFAGIQTRKPEELLFAVAGSLQGNPPASELLPKLADATLHLRGQVNAVNDKVEVRSRQGEVLNISLADFLAWHQDKPGVVVEMSLDESEKWSFLLFVVSPPSGEKWSAADAFRVSFEHELEPHTIVIYASPEKLAVQAYVEDHVKCVTTSCPACGLNSNCGQPRSREDGALFDFSLYRAAGYKMVVPR